MRACMSACVRAYMHAQAHRHTSTQAHRQTCTCVHMHICIYACMHIRIHAYMHTCIHAYDALLSSAELSIRLPWKGVGVCEGGAHLNEVVDGLEDDQLVVIIVNTR